MCCVNLLPGCSCLLLFVFVPPSEHGSKGLWEDKHAYCFDGIMQHACTWTSGCMKAASLWANFSPSRLAFFLAPPEIPDPRFGGECGAGRPAHGPERPLCAIFLLRNRDHQLNEIRAVRVSQQLNIAASSQETLVREAVRLNRNCDSDVHDGDDDNDDTW